MNVTPASHILLCGNGKSLMDPTRRILLFCRSQLLGHAVPERPDMLFIKGEDVSARFRFRRFPSGLGGPLWPCRGAGNGRGFQRGQSVPGQVFGDAFVIDPNPGISADSRRNQPASLRSDPANARRTESSLPSSAAFRSVPSSSRPSNDTDGGAPCRPVPEPDNATTRRATFNSAGSSISASQPSSAAAGTGIRRASRGIIRSRSRACHLRHRFFVAHQLVESHQRVPEIQV